MAIAATADGDRRRSAHRGAGGRAPNDTTEDPEVRGDQGEDEHPE